MRPATPDELAGVVELAFDYRGDVTLDLASGQTVEGYVYNRDARSAHPSLHIFLRHEPGSARIPYEDIVAVTFSGEDTAFGKSWQAWAAKQESQRRAEAERVEGEARARGHL